MLIIHCQSNSLRIKIQSDWQACTFSATGSPNGREHISDTSHHAGTPPAGHSHVQPRATEGESRFRDEPQVFLFRDFLHEISKQIFRDITLTLTHALTLMIVNGLFVHNYDQISRSYLPIKSVNGITNITKYGNLLCGPNFRLSPRRVWQHRGHTRGRSMSASKKTCRRYTNPIISS